MIVIGGPGAKKIGGKPALGSDEPDGDEEEATSTHDEAMLEASRAMIKALKMNDPKMFGEAFHAAYMACSRGEHCGDSEE
jgi:hypothetical protein